MFKVILFDADGMVIVSKRFSDQLQADCGITWDKMEPFFNGPFQRCKLGQTDLKEELTKAMIDWGGARPWMSLSIFGFVLGRRPMRV